MSGIALPEASLRFLLRLAEMARPVISCSCLAEELGDDAHQLIEGRYVVPDDARRSILLPVGETEIDVPVELDSETGRLRCFHPEAGFMEVDPNLLRVFRLAVDRLPQLVRALLDLPVAVKPLPLAPDLLWDLGEDFLTHRKFPVYLARRLGQQGDHGHILDTLTKRRARGPSLLLATGAIPAHLTLPAEFRAIAITDCLVRSDRGARADKAILRGAMLGEQFPASVEPLSHTLDFTVVTVHGKEYSFTGSKQRAVVRQLIAAFRAGQPKCLTTKVLVEAGYRDSVNTLAKAFSRRGDWRDFIAEEAGSCWIFI